MTPNTGANVPKFFVLASKSLKISRQVGHYNSSSQAAWRPCELLKTCKSKSVAVMGIQAC